ncbi:hypothetical protein WN51_12307 [Melipona quadrifasciata]|uniref:Uncharacterized protein n=1 Tax=Melipona quadrifasciata TaxID=166423 RepID=A0A0M9AE65_9HYME|nr:hypothetical protein WN51_12307 [Melipona quadrifasciata]
MVNETNQFGYQITERKNPDLVERMNCSSRRITLGEPETEEITRFLLVLSILKHPRPRIPQIRVSNTRLAQAASGCAPSVDVLPIFDVKQQTVQNPARMGAPALVGLVTTSVWGKESLPSAPLMDDESRQLKYTKNYE